MTQPKTPPLSIRAGTERLAQIDAWATDHGLTRHAAVLALIDLGLRSPVPSASLVPPEVPMASSVAEVYAQPVRGIGAPTPGRMTMDDVRPKFVPRLKADTKKR